MTKYLQWAAQVMNSEAAAMLEEAAIEARLLSTGCRDALEAKHNPYSPKRALKITRRAQLHQVIWHQRQKACGLTTLTPAQQELFADLTLAKPTANVVQTSM